MLLNYQNGQPLKAADQLFSGILKITTCSIIVYYSGSKLLELAQRGFKEVIESNPYYIELKCKFFRNYEENDLPSFYKNLKDENSCYYDALYLKTLLRFPSATPQLNENILELCRVLPFANQTKTCILAEEIKIDQDEERQTCPSILLE